MIAQSNDSSPLLKLNQGDLEQHVTPASFPNPIAGDESSSTGGWHPGDPAVWRMGSLDPIPCHVMSRPFRVPFLDEPHCIVMAITLESISKGKAERAPRIVLLGVEKIGKSTFAAGAADPIFIPVKGEEGVDALDVAKFPTAAKYQDVLDMLGVLYSEEHDYGTVGRAESPDETGSASRREQ